MKCAWNMKDSSSGQAYPATHEAFWPEDIFGQGIGWIVLARFKSRGQRVLAGVFLVDVFCLGVKMAIYEQCDTQDYAQRIRDHYWSKFPMVPVDPRVARQLLEQAVQYAQALGFPPHPDYSKAIRAFEGLRAGPGIRQFTFGSQGKPFYRRGPRETEDQARRIVWQLEKRCGPGNYNYFIPLGDPANIGRASA
jgi:hypothetical protein